MKNLGFPKMFLGVQIAQSTKGLIIFQQDLIDRILLRFKMQHVTVQSTPMDSKQSFSKLMDEYARFYGPYRQAIGCLQYLVTGTRPDLATSISMLDQYTNFLRLLIGRLLFKFSVTLKVLAPWEFLTIVVLRLMTLLHMQILLGLLI